MPLGDAAEKAPWLAAVRGACIFDPSTARLTFPPRVQFPRRVASRAGNWSRINLTRRSPQDTRAFSNPCRETVLSLPSAWFATKQASPTRSVSVPPADQPQQTIATAASHEGLSLAFP